MGSFSGRSAPLLAGLAATGLAALVPAAAAAGGFAVFEQGARGMGLAGAFTAQASDPSAIFHNPAGLGFLSGRQAYAGGTLVAPTASFRGADPFPGAAVSEKGAAGVSLPPTAYYSQQLTERLVVGAGWTTPFELRTRWAQPDAFSGRFIAQHAEIEARSLNPTVACKLADRLAVGLGVELRFSSLSLGRRLPVIDPFTQQVTDAASMQVDSGTELGLGFDVGVLARPTTSLSVGVSYRHRVEIGYEGSATVTPVATGNPELDAAVAAELPAGSVPVKSTVVFPGVVSVGAAYTWRDWTVEADVNWRQWSSLGRVLLVFESRPDLNQVLAEGYSNAWEYRLGVERPLDPVWTARGGLFFDQSPAPAVSLSPVVPDADRFGLALGGSWKPGRFWVDAGARIVLGRSRSTGGQSPDHFDGTYKSRAVTLGISAGYAF